MRKIGIYGGTFDPVHNAHLILAREAFERLQLERVVFVPAAVSPHKLERAAAPAPLRLEMLRAAIEEEPGFSLDDIELCRLPPSFTIDTVEELGRREPEATMLYLVGSDNLPRLHMWHRFDELEKLVQFVILARDAKPIDERYTTIRRLIDVSATDIRNRVATGRSIRYLVPTSVEEIIHRHQLYKEPTRSLPKN
ncbi:MAG TPA: nicotinate-nucleotide adenylyltransferase [Chthoniobacterales bacterium]|nr:nicotinate-nucleotide adenylyltransferase [Chthoniobacterales bacterium]